MTKFVPFTERHGSIPHLEPITARVLDVSDPEQFPEIAAACEWVRSRRIANDER